MLAGSGSSADLELEGCARVGGCHWIRRLGFDSIAGRGWGYCNAASEAAGASYDDADRNFSATVRGYDSLGQAEGKIRRRRAWNYDRCLGGADDLAGGAGNSHRIVAGCSL